MGGTAIWHGCTDHMLELITKLAFKDPPITGDAICHSIAIFLNSSRQASLKLKGKNRGVINGHFRRAAGEKLLGQLCGAAWQLWQHRNEHMQNTANEPRLTLISFVLNRFFLLTCPNRKGMLYMPWLFVQIILPNKDGYLFTLTLKELFKA